MPKQTHYNEKLLRYYRVLRAFIKHKRLFNEYKNNVVCVMNWPQTTGFIAMSPLAQLYSTSTMEHHHFDQCIMILSTDVSHDLFGLW